MSPMWIRKTLTVIILSGLLGYLCFGGGGWSTVHAQESDRLTDTELTTPVPSAQATSPSNNEYFISKTITFSGGASLEEYIINGPPLPPPGYELERTAVFLPESNKTLGIKTLIVPVFRWSFGCSATSGAMIAGYHDRNGFANMYTGPTNGGVVPLDSSSWPDWTDGYGATYAQCPLTASHNGLDGRTTRGSIDDYWVKYNGGFQDPYSTNGWTQHAWGEAIGDYMKTSQYAYGNTDGSTSFYNWTSSASQLTCGTMVGYNIHTKDGTYGRKLFYEARGYTVTDCYSQKTDNTISGGFSFAQFKAEIDAGRPVMLNLAGHTVIGAGYDDSTQTVYIHDTWDYSTHTMTWGGSYSGMQLLSVSIVNLQTYTPPPSPTPTATTNPATGVTASGAILNGTVNPNGLPTTYYFQWGPSTAYGQTTAIQSAGSGTSNVAVSANLTGLTLNTTYHYRIIATNSSGTAYGADRIFITSVKGLPWLLLLEN